MFDQYATVPQIARAIGRSKQTVYKLIKDGEFPSVRKAASNRFRGEPGYEVTLYDIEAYLRRRAEAKERPKKKNTKVKNDDVKQLLTELHNNMIQQAEIIGKLLEKL